jgi:hypothetical protein
MFNMLNVNDKKSFVDERAWILDSNTVKDKERVVKHADLAFAPPTNDHN